MSQTLSRRLVRSTLTAAVAAGTLLVVTVTATPTATAAAAVPSGWSIVPSANTSPQEDNALIRDTCTNAWNCWAVGTDIPDPSAQNSKPTALIEHWNGAAWSVTSSSGPPGSRASALWDVTCVTGSDCWAVGGVQTGQGQKSAPSALTEHWNGSSWTIVPNPVTAGYFFAVTCTGTADCWATGATTVAGDNGDAVDGIIDHWDGSSWSPAALPDTGATYSQLMSVTCTSASNCWAAGVAGPNQVTSGLLPGILPKVTGDQALVEHWDGAGWSIADLPQAGPSGSYLSGVTCAASSECWAVGSTTDADGDPAGALVDRWDGSSWSTSPSPDPAANDLLTDVSCLSATACWAVGIYGLVSGGQGAPSSFVEQWNGSTWSVQPSPDVTALGYLNGVACVGGTGCVAVGFAGTNISNSLTVQTMVEQMVLPPAGNQGVLLAGTDGGVFTFGTARFAGSLGGMRLDAPIVGMAPTPDDGGYWLVAADGGVFSFGDATFYGSEGSTPLAKPIVGMAADPNGGGYWLVAADGGVFSFGASPFEGSTGGIVLAAPVVGMATTPDGGGYWLVAADGGVFSFGDADYLGSVPGQGIVHHPPVVGIAATPGGNGYWVVDQDGGVYSYGDASFLGSLTGTPLSAPVTAVADGL